MGILEGRRDSTSYIATLQPYGIQFTSTSHQCDALFMPYNAGIHTPKLSMNWLQAMDFDVVDWPGRAPNLSHLQNILQIFGEEVLRTWKAVSDWYQFEELYDGRLG